MKIELKNFASLLLIFLLRSASKATSMEEKKKNFKPSIDVYRAKWKLSVYTRKKKFFAGTNELHNYSLENRFLFLLHSLNSHPGHTTKCLRHPTKKNSEPKAKRASIAIKMLLFIANVSVKRVSCLLLLLMLLWSLPECVWQIDCPLWLSELDFFFSSVRRWGFSVSLTFAW
jgi:hypothetical protein